MWDGLPVKTLLDFWELECLVKEIFFAKTKIKLSGKDVFS
jgi:hypothetical protein